MDSVSEKIWQLSPHSFNCRKVRRVQLSSNFLLLLSQFQNHVRDLNTFFEKHTSKVGKYHREEKQDFKRLLIFLNIKIWTKSNKIELSEEFSAMWREQQNPWDLMSPLIWGKNEKDKSLKRMSDTFQIFSDWYFWIKFCFRCEIFFKLTPEILKFQLCFKISIKTAFTSGHTTSLQLSIPRLVSV